MENNVQSTATRLNLTQSHDNVIVGQAPAPVNVLFSYLFDNRQTLKARNGFLLLFLQNHIEKNDVDTIRKVLAESNTFIYDLDLSFIKAILLMTEHFAAASPHRNKLQTYFNESIQ